MMSERRDSTVLLLLVLAQADGLSPPLQSLLFRSAAQDPPITALQSGQPMAGSVLSGAFEYYSFEVDSPALLNITCVPTSPHGDPDLYVSDSFKYPNQLYFNYSSTSVGVDEVVVRKAAARTYYIGVLGYTAAAYTIVATASPPLLSL